jgi:capsular exopolysaccharide synthesis family protein
MKREDDKYVEIEDRESNIIEKIASNYLPYWPLLLLFIFLSLTAAYVYLRYATPMYAAQATIIIKDNSKGGDDSKVMDQLNLIASNKSIENEIQVLQSRALMETVVKRLFLYAPILQQGKIKAGDAYMLSPIVVEVKNTDSMIEVKEVNFDYDNTSSIVLLNKKDKFPVNQFVNTPYGVLRFVPNYYYRPFMESPNRQLSFSLENPSNVAVDILKGLVVTSNSALVNLSFKDPIPQRAINILNNLIDIYEERSVEDKNVLSKNTLAFVNERLAVLGKDLDSIEKKVQQFKSGSNAVNISDQGGFFLNAATTTDQKIGEINNQAAVLDEMEKYVTGASAKGALVPSTLGIGDPTLTGLLNKLYTSEIEYDKLKNTLGENNPKMIALADEIGKMKPDILNNIKSQKATIGASRQSLSATSNGFNSILRSLPQKERQLLVISREQQSKSNLYQFLLQKKNESELSIANTLTNSRVVDKAFAGSDPVSPKPKIIYMLALIGAFGLFVGIIIGKDLLTGKIKYRSEIEKMTSIPIIGEIAFDKTNTALVIEKGTRSFVAEEFRKLRISLSFLGIDSGHKKLLLTSSISGEGKSFIAANLGVSISLTGKKVVLVDMDLNNPTLSKILNVNYEDGVTEFLTGEKSAEQIINKIANQENLYFISAGSLPENPSELLANGKVKSLIDYLESNFDMVVIDTSPMVLVTDAYILSELCDATLYIIRHNYTPKMLVKRIDENNQINPINNPAIIFNGVKTKGMFKNNYGYGYDYVYGNKERGGKAKNVS